MLASAASVLASSALAQDRNAYIGGEIGALMVNNADIDMGAVNNAVTVDHELGYDARLIIGYDLGDFRVEGEFAHKKANLESYHTVIRLPLEGAVFPPEREAGGGSSTALSFMINGLSELGDYNGVSGFIGGGIGAAQVQANGYRNFSNAVPFLDTSDSKFALQIIAGARRAIRENIDVTLKYNFFNVEGIRGVAFNGDEAEFRFRSHSVTAGLTFNFGGS